ncbi:hypothetical protein LPB138_07765 [Urechidicola croceus]|uniref:6-phosphogluconolactonase n=2 Tax=Urechidicola croceus TaxID=1850246 RepID=A0A1D8PC20_9FLAO|nr:hypothetical protein LPB138_07765 [Urechidicola croceus]
MSQAPKKVEAQELLVGTYTDATSKGIYKMFFNSETGELENKGLVAEAVSPSYFAISKDRQYVYSVNEMEKGEVSSFKWNDDRTQLNLVSNVSSEGMHPCYAELNSDESMFATANYSSGNIAVYNLDGKGGIQEHPQTGQHTGKSIVVPNQEAPHAHCVKFSKDNNFLYAVDLGIDEIVLYPIDSQGKLDAKQTALKLDAGDGPRHIIYHPTKDIAFIINELSSSVVSVKINTETGAFEKIDKKSTLPEGFKGKSFCADIHISSDGKFLYASNRGHNTIGIFSVSENGELELIGNESVQGEWPRNFVISPNEKFLLVANKDTNNITVFSIDAETGLLTFTGNEIELSKPICLKF